MLQACWGRWRDPAVQVQGAMERALYVWSVRNPASGSARSGPKRVRRVRCSWQWVRLNELLVFSRQI